MNYTVISYTPGNPGVAYIKVNGCKFQTGLDVAAGIVQGDDKWNALVNPIVASVLDAMNPASLNYDPTLVG